MSKRIFILGSCVSRDAFGQHNANLFQVETYVARTSLASAMSAPAMGAKIVLDNINSPFQRRMVELDIQKGLPALLQNSNPDLFLLDLIDERFNLFVSADGAICTISPELSSSGFNTEQQPGVVIPAFSDAFFDLWENGWNGLLALLQQRQLLPRLYVNRVFWSSVHEDGTPFEAGYTVERIGFANAFLKLLYQRMEQDLRPQQFIHYPERMLVGANNHRWGSSPFHYVEKFYAHTIGCMTHLITPAPTAAATVAAAATTTTADLEILLRQSSMALDSEIAWHEVVAPQGATIQIDLQISCAQDITERSALLSVDCRDPAGHPITLDGFSLSRNPQIGTYRYLNTGGGKHSTSFRLTLPIGFKSLRLGVRSWNAEHALGLEWLTVTLIPRKKLHKRPSTIISVDVEALPGRAQQDYVERLIYGRFGDGQSAGIERLCELFDRFNAKATFFVDYSTCDLHVADGIFRASEMLKARGHDVQLHLHSEVLVRLRRWPHDPYRLPAFDVLDVDVATACLEYGIEQFKRNLGERPRIFRPGGMRHSKKMYLAAKNAGVEAVSGLYRGASDSSWPLVADQAVFRWDNGILEAPLDFALDPLVSWGDNRRLFNELLESRSAHPVMSVLIHSTSLLFRTLSGKPQHFTGPHQAYENQLLEYLQWFAEMGQFTTYSALLDGYSAPNTIALDQFYPNETEVTIAQTATSKTDVGRHFNRDYRLTIAVPSPDDEASNLRALVPAILLPLKLAPKQRLVAITVQGMRFPLTYILYGHKAYLLCQRLPLPIGAALRTALEQIFRRHPQLELVIAESVLEEAAGEAISGYSEKTECRRSFILNLPNSWIDYSRNIINASRQDEILFQEVSANATLNVRWKLQMGETLTLGDFARATDFLKNDPAQESPFLWDIYRERGALVSLANERQLYAVALCLFVQQGCYVMAAASRSLSADVGEEMASSFALDDLVLYRLIEYLIGRNYGSISLGAGEAERKMAFGASEYALHTFHFARSDGKTQTERVRQALINGESALQIETDMASPLETLLAPTFAADLGLDFEPLMDDGFGGAPALQWRATTRDAFMQMMRHLPAHDGDVFVDVACGKGKMLYYACLLGYKKCIGIEHNEKALRIASANLEKLKPVADIVLMHRDLARIDRSELQQGNVFYLFNPFSEEILQCFLRSLLASQKAVARRLYIVYCVAKLSAVLEMYGFKPVHSFKDGHDGWRFGASAIFVREAG